MIVDGRRVGEEEGRKKGKESSLAVAKSPTELPSSFGEGSYLLGRRLLAAAERVTQRARQECQSRWRELDLRLRWPLPPNLELEVVARREFEVPFVLVRAETEKEVRDREVY